VFYVNITRVEMGIGKVHFPLGEGMGWGGGGLGEGLQGNSIASQCFILMISI